MASIASSESTITTLLRPRYISVAIIAVAAVTTLGYGLWHDIRRRAARDEEIRRATGSLHRSNAVRRSRRASTELAGSTSQHTTQTNGLDAADASDPTNSHTAENPANDENAREPATGGDPADTAMDDAEADERWLDDTSPPPMHHRAGQNIVSLLFRVSEDNARRSSYVHRGCACNACGIVPIRGIRYRCANCADFDLCETCESQGLHIKTHIFYKVKVPAPPFGPRQMQPVWYPGDPDTRVRNLSKSLINRLSRETGFERQELEAFWEQWTYMANTEWRDDPDELFLAMDRKTFERCLVPSGGYRHTAPNLIHDRMFAFYDTNNDDLIGFSEFLHGLSYRKRKDKLHRIFDGYDTDRDGYVSRRDFLRFFRAYYVLYKQMQRDILEGLDNQVMGSVETHQLVNGRQPLSSMFGREGRVPAANLQRTMAGKVINNQTGETIVHETANGIVTEDSTDTAHGEDLMASLFTRWSRHLTTSGMYQDRYVGDDDMTDVLDDGLAASNYWDALLNPPARVQDLPSLLIGQVDPSSQAGHDDDDDDDDDDMFVPDADTFGDGADIDSDDIHWVGVEPASEQPHAFQDTSRSASGATSPEDDTVASAEAHGRAAGQAPSSPASNGGIGFAVLDGALQDQYRMPAPSAQPRFNPHHPPTLGQIRAQHEATMRKRRLRSSKIIARRKLHDRWIRRNFYLDEEEGATVPSEFPADADILAGVAVSGAAGEPSASRVRFSEKDKKDEKDEKDGKDGKDEKDEKDETQPSPSSSARTVLPDTWGADNGRCPDIPEAERDAGREILYQVMQQSFNEMLDTLFADKEDLAIKAAKTKDMRDQYRHLFHTIDLVKEWRLLLANYPEDQAKPSTSHADDKAAHGSRSTGIETLDRTLDQMDLEDLLTLSGYQVNEEGYADNGEAFGATAATGEAGEAELAGIGRLVREGAPEPEPRGMDGAQASAKEEETEDEQEGGEEGGEEDEDDADEVETNEPRDTTLPQFRPNTEAEYLALSASQAARTATTKKTAKRSTTVEDAVDVDAAKDAGAKGKKKEAGTATVPDISRQDLARLKGLDLAEREANLRGGWGKLDYTEFEAIFRREEIKNNRLDYLGSWIDFCIP